MSLTFAVASRALTLQSRSHRSCSRRAVQAVSDDDGDRVAVTFRGREIAAEVGATLRTALIRGGVSPHNGNSKIICCRGLGTCGTCAVEITRGAVVPGERSARERARLSLPPHTAANTQRHNLRLACQVRIQAGPLAIAKYDGFWGHGEQPAPVEE
mmetsp:Transcript_41865/g.103046  ORF Transcript_41865/g.103046 Transcript_41865/m.103046 type:complete len:156 (-) Transcript_41865:6-473(-)